MQNKRGRLYPYITSGFNYYGPFTVQILNNYRTISGITLSTFCVEVIIIYICYAFQRQCATEGIELYAIFGRTRLFSWVSGSSNGEQVV